MARGRGRGVGRVDRGAAAVEMALVLPILLLLVFGIIDFGRMLNAQIRLTEAAREAARAHVLGDPNPRSRFNTVVSGMTGADLIPIRNCSAPTATSDAEFKATYEFRFVTPVGVLAGLAPGGSPTGTIPLTATGVMPCRA